MLRSKHYIFWLLVVMLVVLSGCGSGGPPLKTFLFNNPNLSFKIDNSIVYDKYSSIKELEGCNVKGGIIIVYLDATTYELLLSSKYQQIGQSPYSVRLTTG